jgi:hypothetical protein
VPTTLRDSRAPGWINILLTQSIEDAVAAVGAGDGLDALTWSVSVEGREIFVLGTPPVGTPEPRALCLQWARSLRMIEGAHDDDERVITWNRYERPWIIEISMGSGPAASGGPAGD